MNSGDKKFMFERLMIKDILNLIGNELKDGSEQTKKFREFIEKDKWSLETIKSWLDECIEESSGAHDPYNKAFQDLIVSLGKRLGFNIEYGRYLGKSGEDNYDGIWKSENEDIIVIEVKSSTWPIGSVSQLGEYIVQLEKKYDNERVFGLYVIGKGEIQPLIEQIIGSKYKDKIRVILYSDLIDLINLKLDLAPVVGESKAIDKIRSLLFPIESINIGNIIKLIREIAEAVSEQGPDDGDGEEKIWTRDEILEFLKGCAQNQKVLISAMAQAEKDPIQRKYLLILMNDIAKKKSFLGIEKELSEKEIAGSRAGLKIKIKSLGKEDFIEGYWDKSVKDYMYKIKDEYKNIILEWVKSENLEI
jgi:hypothetical protein